MHTIVNLYSSKKGEISRFLHDFYDKPWQSNNHKLVKQEKVKFFKQHGFVHAKEAAKNAYKYLYIFLYKYLYAESVKN